MIPNVTYGRRVRGLLEYLWGPGKSEEHTNPRIVAGYDDPSALVPPASALDGERVDLAGLAARLDAPQVAAGERGMRRYVWQCSLSLPPQEAPLDDATWGSIATRFVTEMGFGGDAERAGCRWIAVHHGTSKGGNDHIHVVVTLATEDGAPVWLRGDKGLSQKVADALEDEFGLGKWCRRDGGERRPGTSRAETERGEREDRAPAREELRRQVRAAAAGASSESEWIARMRAAGLLVNPYLAPSETDRVVGYGVALANRDATEPVWFNARTLDGELSLRRMRQRWPSSSALTAAEWKTTAAAKRARRLNDEDRIAVWRSSTAALGTVAARMAEVPTTSPEWPAIARGSADVLVQLALVAEPRGTGPLSRAADALSRAAAPRRREPPAVDSQLGDALGQVAIGLAVAGRARNPGEALIMLAMVVAAARLVTQLAELRRAQDQAHAGGAAQAAAARLVPVLSQAAQAGVLSRATETAAPDAAVTAADRAAARPAQPAALERGVPGRSGRDEEAR